MRAFQAVRAVLVGGALALANPGCVSAQDFGRIVSQIVTLDREKLFEGTLFGQRLNRELDTAALAMAAQTREIEAALEAEEKALTEQRATLSAEAFRPLAQAFDDKVQALRAERDAADADLRAQIEAAQTTFFQQIGPILGQLIRDRGAVLIVDRRAVLLAAGDVDITPDAIERIDAVLGEGPESQGTPEPLPTPQTAPDAPTTDPLPGSDTGLDTIPAPDPQPDTATGQ